jgi:threonine/homoserine/homoserine lactone efflux protein
MSWEFFITSLIVILIPGTGVLYTIAVGLGRGFRASIVAALGCTAGIIPHMLASIVGLAAVLHASAVAFQTLKWFGVAYLFYMAWGMLKAGGAMDVEPQTDNRSDLRIIRDAVAINSLNPKLSIFFLAFLPQFVPANAQHGTALMTGLAIAFMAMTFAVFVLYGACASIARDYVISRPRVVAVVKRSFAATFGLLGLRLALAER